MSKKVFYFLVSFFLLGAQNVFAVSVDWHGYMRAGTGWNRLGGAQTCVNNSGSAGNEFRLGNECGAYGETTWRAHFLDSVASSGTFDSQLTLAFWQKDYTQYGDADRDLQVVEAFADGGGFDGVPLHFWAGKRFYRSNDIHMDDFYYFAAMNGAGGGVYWTKANHDYKMALLTEVATSGAPVSGVATSVDHTAKSALDLRAERFELVRGQTLDFWAAYAWTPASTDGTANYPYITGFVVGAKHHTDLSGGGNDLALVYGTSILQSMQLTGSVLVPAGSNTLADAKRWRFVEAMTKKFGSNWESHFALVYESASPSSDGVHNQNWMSLGARPVYFITDHYQIAFEAGYSNVQDDSDGRGIRELRRLTVAPQLSASRSIWGRPVLRAFLSNTSWNQANQTTNLPVAFQGKLDNWNLGMQTELWY